MPVLHQMHMSGNCYKIRLAARQLGVALTLKNYGLHDGTTRKPDFLAKNPNGRVPLLEFENGRTLAESGAILWHLSEDTFLLPADRWARAEALQWMFFEQYSHEPNVAVARFILQFVKHPDDPRLPEKTAGSYRALDVMETHLATRTYFVDEQYTIADIALYAYTHVADQANLDLGRYPAIRAWLARVKAQPRHIEMPGVDG